VVEIVPLVPPPRAYDGRAPGITSAREPQPRSRQPAQEIRPMPYPARLVAAAAAALGALVLAGCAAPPTATDAIPTASVDASAAIDDCGVAVTPRAAPAERIVAVKSTAAELVVALGLGDALVATAFLDAPFETEGTPPPTIEGMPSREAVLALEPDAVVAGWESAFAPEAAGDRAALSYPSPPYRPGRILLLVFLASFPAPICPPPVVLCHN
jgi:hypothetical protein